MNKVLLEQESVQHEGGIVEEEVVKEPMDYLLNRIQEKKGEGRQTRLKDAVDAEEAAQTAREVVLEEQGPDWNLQKELKSYKKRTEMKLPNIFTIPGDCVFWDEFNFLTLEYLIYPEELKVKKLEGPINTIKGRGENENEYELAINPETGEPYSFALGTQNYNISGVKKEGDSYIAFDLRNETEKDQCVFNEGVGNYKPSKEEYKSNMMVKTWSEEEIEKCKQIDQVQNPQDPKVTEDVIDGWRHEKVHVQPLLTSYFAGISSGKPFFTD